MAVRRPSIGPSMFRQASWWVVLVAGALTVLFLVAIVREVVSGYTIRQQVKRLEQQVGAEQKRQAQLDALISYLSSPTFQEREARLKLGLKKSGERVIVVPPAGDAANGNENVATPSGGPTAVGPTSNPQRWWTFFFGPRRARSS